MAADEHSLIPVVCGATAAGKSALALWLAQRQPTTIIVADSRQIYRGFDIGTAKPNAAERAAVPHRGIDIVEPMERYSAAAWAESADQWIGEALHAGRVPLVVGGTGFYLRALFEPLFDEPVLDAGSRRQMEQVLARLSLGELTRWVDVLDPDRAHLGRTQLLRAIEVALLSGRRVSELHRERARPARRAARYLVVDPGPELSDRISARLDTMLAGGWVDEVKRLMSEIPENAPAWNASGYRAVREYVRGKGDLGKTRETILIETRQYAKRQRTWLRNQLDTRDVTRVDPTDSSWPTLVERWLNETLRRSS
ncbi:MAG TPA: tRNA (adenosine(37)-N6)-dimethylallyltransferase MiaA [Gemmatimonadaceae bacterium]|nr:tRNA (adenosine(37)-N6)-dimethylallyltransferase MiaA [Gemmatimonadaceae bacterium]